MKKPEEIKKGLECCCGGVRCEQCPYQPECDLPFGDSVNADALALIQQLEVKDSQVKKALQDNGFSTLDEFLQAYSQLKRERDAAVSELPHNCWNCKYHLNEPIEETDDYGRTIHRYCDADVCYPDEENSSWEWRGVQKEECP